MSDQYRNDPFWTSKKLTPVQLAIHDISFERRDARRDDRLDIDEVPYSSLVPDEDWKFSERLREKWQAQSDAISALNFSSKIEEKALLVAQQQYGWMSEARLDDEDDHIHCRWIHISSKFSMHLRGVLVGMSDWTTHGRDIVNSVRELERCTQDQERFSKHGKQFAPFCASLNTRIRGTTKSTRPLLISVPFLDWGVHPDQETPALRFQIDEREAYHFAKSVMHPLRSLLQYYYRLEDTSERERQQVYAKHRPWYTDRDTDLKVRRWYGHYPSSSVVDELWILVIDERHIVSFSSNQTWKSRWPPLQLSSRIAELSFRSIRDAFDFDSGVKYSSMHHAIACLHGAMGLMHRSFWTDQPLPCTERYGGYLSHLQYRIYRSPSTRLVMDLLQTQDELNICHHITQKQLEILAEVKQYLYRHFSDPSEICESPPLASETSTSTAVSPPPMITQFDNFVPQPLSAFRNSQRDTFQAGSPTSPRNTTTNPALPLALQALLSVETKLQREQDDLSELRKNSNELITRTIQLVNIRMEDHGQAVLVFTVVTVIFLPLSFMASFFGMNTTGIRDLNYGQWIFWASGLTLTIVVVILSVVLAFYGGQIHETFSDWKAGNMPHGMNGIKWQMPNIGIRRKRPGDALTEKLQERLGLSIG